MNDNTVPDTPIYHLLTFDGDWAVITDAAGGMVAQGHHDDMRRHLLEILGIEEDYRGDAHDHPQFGIVRARKHPSGHEYQTTRSIFQLDAKFEV